jgi:type III secretion system FlhB-like substrate exporter
MKSSSEKKPEEPVLPAPSYPALESFIETATEAEIEVLYQPLLEALAELKGPQADKARKIDVAISKSSELLKLLLEVRTRLEEGAAKQRAPR